MEGIIFKNKEYQKIFDYLVSTKCQDLSNSQKSLIKIIIIHYKKYTPDEYYILLTLLYGFTYFGVLDLSNKHITDRDRLNLYKLKESFSYEVNGDKDKYIDSIINMDNDLFLLKMIIKYTILSIDGKYLKIIPNFDNYIKSIGYIIPYLTLKEFNLLGFFQDIYFEKMYNKEYKNTKKNYFKNINNADLPGVHLVDIVNDLSELMCNSGSVGRVRLRKKTFFSIYNKLIRKGTKKIDDSIGARIIFKTFEDMNKFVLHFEDVCVILDKKDYYLKPKSNGYKSIHYNFLSPYKNKEIKVDLQLRTKKIAQDIKKTKDLSHYTYTVKENKWAKIFKEVNYGYEYINNLKKDD